MTPEEAHVLDAWKQHPMTINYFNHLYAQRNAAVKAAVSNRRLDLNSAQLELERVAVIDKILEEVKSGNFVQTQPTKH